MSYIEPTEPGVTVVRRTYDPVTATTTEIRRETRSSGTGWWVMGIVLVAAIIATAFILARNESSPVSDQTMAAATAQGSAQTAAQDAQNAAALAQANAQASIQASQTASQTAAVDAARAQAEVAASRAASEAQPPRDVVTPPPRTLPPASDNGQPQQ